MSRTAIRQTLTRMNWTFGRGDLGRINWKEGTVSRTIPITQLTRSDPQKLKFAVIGKYVRFLGRRRLVKRHW